MTAGARQITRVASAAVAIVAMVATPLAPKGGAVRRMLSNVVVGGLFATTSATAATRWGPARAAVAASSLPAATLLVERAGTRTGIPFGRYSYTGRLRPTIAGVPAVVPLAWFAMAVPAREAAHAALGARSTPLTRIVAGSVALTAWDLFLDPQMVSEGYWRWARAGRYRGIPASNFVGWLLTGAAVMAALELLLPAREEADAAAVGQYAFVASMECVGFAAFFRDRTVAAVGGAGMLPIAALAVRRLLTR